MVESSLDFFSILCYTCLCFVTHMSWFGALELFGECFDIVLQKFVLFSQNLYNLRLIKYI